MSKHKLKQAYVLNNADTLTTNLVNARDLPQGAKHEGECPHCSQKVFFHSGTMERDDWHFEHAKESEPCPFMED